MGIADVGRTTSFAEDFGAVINDRATDASRSTIGSSCPARVRRTARALPDVEFIGATSSPRYVE
jgi:hypothetical protein